MKKTIRYLLVLIFIVLLVDTSSPSFGDNSVNVVIQADKVIGKVNPFVFGSGIIGYDPSTMGKLQKKYVGYTNYGGGVWNPKKKEVVFDVTELMKKAGLTILRFPGGKEASFYNWKETIGPADLRPDFLYGLDEFLRTSEEIAAEAILVLPYFSGTPQDASDLVEYLNAPHDGSNPGGGKDWASERSKNGHPEPYGVRFFELGNEVNYGRTEVGIPRVAPDIYGKDYIEYRKKMKDIDPSIQLGAVTVNSGSVHGISAWNNKVFQVAGKSIDFLIEHTYRPDYMRNDEKVDANKLFESTLNSLDEVNKYYKTLSRHFEMVTGRKDIPVAITEYNARFVQEKPVPFRHTLGTALFNAGLIQLFFKPENNILMANYHQFVNSYWGMIRNDRFMESKGNYIKRPNYYVLEMYNKHFGPELLEVVNIGSENQAISNNENDLLSKVKWESKLFSEADIDVDNDDVTITFSRNEDLNFSHVRKKFSVKPNTTYRLSGYLKAEKLLDNEGVGLEIQDGRGWNKTHSVASTGKVWGSTDWTYVETEYATSSDATDVLIMIRRKSGHGPVKGKVFARDIKLIEIHGGIRKKDSLLVSAGRSADKQTLYIMVLNKNIYSDVKSSLDVRSVRAFRDTVEVWTLNGADVSSNNEKEPDNVIVQHKRIKITDQKQMKFVFPAHSLTALELKIK